MRAEHVEVAATLQALNRCFETLVVRGVKSAGADDVQQLDAIAQEFGRAGASYLADNLNALVHATRENDDDAARRLLRAQTAARVFERVLSLDAAAEALGAAHPPAARGTLATPPAPTEDRKALLPLLKEMAEVVEGLVGSGLTTASAATRQKLDASGKEAARAKLGRLSASLKYVNDELGRFLAESEHFSARRLAFFLNRIWLMSRGLAEAIVENDGPALARLLWQSAPTPVKAVRVVTLGVQKRALLDGGASFDFRLRVLDGGAEIAQGTRLVWSTVFAGKKGIPAEAFLHLPQAQKFTPKLFLERTEVRVTDCAVALDGGGGGRLMLGPKSTVTAGPDFEDWNEYASWSPTEALERVRNHQVTPLDLEVELQEEIIVKEYELGAPQVHPHRPELHVFPLKFGTMELDATVSNGPDGEALFEALKGLRKKAAQRPPLFGVMHYEFCRLVFSPLATHADDGPNHLMISHERIDLASLMKTLDFRT